MCQGQFIITSLKRDNLTARVIRYIAYVAVLLLTLFPVGCSPGRLQKGELSPMPRTSENLDGLNSYRARIALQWILEGESAQVSRTEIEATRDPLAKRITTTSEKGIQEWFEAGGKVWYCTGGTCWPQSRETVSGFGEEVFLWDSRAAEIFDQLDRHYLGEERVNGIHTLHYVILSPPPGWFGPLREDAHDVRTDIWIANEEVLPAMAIRLVTTWKLAGEDKKGKGIYSLDIYDVNVPFVIELPEGIPDALPEDIPLYPAGTQPLLGGGVTFSTKASPATVASFYRIKLAALGWILESEEELRGTFSQLWNKRGWQLKLVISPKEDGCSVVIDMGPR